MDDDRIRDRWAWAFQLGRILVVVWAAWHVWNMISLLLNQAGTLQHIGKAFEIDLAGVSNGRYLAAVGVSVLLHAVLLFFAVGLWRLFTLFLAGRMFTVETACQMRMVGFVGLGLTVMSVLYRPAFYAALDERLLAKVPLWVYVHVDDVLHLVLALLVIGIAAILEIAAPPIHRAEITAGSPPQAGTGIGEIRSQGA